jgi:hypothetical protein
LFLLQQQQAQVTSLLASSPPLKKDAAAAIQHGLFVLAYNLCFFLTLIIKKKKIIQKIILIQSFLQIGEKKTRIVAIGGQQGGDLWASVEMFESETGTWTALPDMSSERGLGPASCVVGGSKIIVAGGRERGDGYLASAEVFDFETKKWTAIAPMREERSFFSGVLLDDGVTFLVTGGYNGAYLASCEQRDTTTMTWSAAPAMATARCKHCTVLYKKNAVVLGGHSATALCEEFDATARKWTTFPPLTQTRYDHGACVLNDEKIFVSGGWVNYSVSASVEVFDGVKWSVLDAVLSATRSDHACAVWEGKVVVLGGTKEGIEVFDEAEKKWRSDVIPKMSTPSRLNLTAVSF